MTRSIYYILLLSISILLPNCKQEVEALNQSQQEIDYTLVREAPIIRNVDAPPVQAIGRVSSDTEVKLSFKIGGVISKMSAREGAYVKKGHLLAEVRTDEIDAQVLKANRALQKAQRDLDRINAMYADSAATYENVQDLTTLVQVTQADLDVALFNQNYAKIVAPISGRILKRIAEPNELVSPGQPIYVLAASKQGAYIMKAALSDRDITKVAYRDNVEMQFDAFPDEIFNGQIVNIAESADPRTGTFDLEISIVSKGKRIRNGLIGTIDIQPNTSGGYLRLPVGAIVEAIENEVTFYSAIENDTIAKEWKADVAHIGSDYILIKDNLDIPYERVLTSGASYLQEGSKIRIQR